MEVHGICILYICALLSLSGFTSSYPDVSNSCRKVKEKFSHLKLGSEDLVPDTPIIDESLQVCSRSLTHAEKKSCCSQDSEMKYVLASEEYLMKSIQSKNAYLKSLIAKHLLNYQDKVLMMVKSAENKTAHQLTDWYSIPWSEHRLAISSLFVDLEQFIKTGHTSIPNSITKFFDNIFPVMFKNNVYDRNAEPFSHHFHHCLSKHRQSFKPFGDFPDRLTQKITTAMIISRSYIEGLTMVMEAILTTDNLILEDGCKHAVTRLQYCSHCRGFMDVKPCKGFCMDVMRGCLSKLTEIGPEWSDIITSVESMVKDMNEDGNIANSLQDLVTSISDALMHAMVHVPDFYENVKKTCDLPADLGQGRDFPYKLPDASKVTMAQGPTPGSEVITEVMQVALDLVDAKGLYSNLADDICRQTALYEQDPLSGTCWNGTEVSVYLRDVVDSDILSQARNNQEMKVSLILDPKLRSLRDKMAVTNLKLQGHGLADAHDSKDVMLSDDPVLYAASGDTNPWIKHGGGTTLDDEDFDDFSGSGSGEGDDVDKEEPEVNVVLGNGKETDKPSGGNRPYETNRGGTFKPDRPPNKKTNAQTDGTGGVSMATPASLWLLLCAAVLVTKVSR